MSFQAWRKEFRRVFKKESQKQAYKIILAAFLYLLKRSWKVAQVRNLFLSDVSSQAMYLLKWN